MTLRVFEEGWRNQYERMRRSRAQLENMHRTSDEFDDAFYHAVQDAWHLKDWIKEDDKLGEQLRSEIINKVESAESLGIVADLANCTKHLVLTKQHSSTRKTAKYTLDDQP